MRRRVLALASIGWGLAALGLVACAGDDTNPPLPDAGAIDATTADGSSGDSSAATDGGRDGGAIEAGECVPFDAAALSDAAIQAGLKIVQARKCQTCHGQQLQGNQNGLPSKGAEGGTAYPPDLTPDPETGLGCWSNAEIERAFLHGIDNDGIPMCDPMPRFGEMGDAGIDEAGAAAVIAYLRSIPAIASPYIPSTPACYPVPPADGGEDASSDAGDAAVVDAAPDATLADAGPDAQAADAGPDATLADAGSDAQVADAADAADANGDDASDAGTSDAGLDGD